jgi:hypothetical protein
MIHIWKIIRYQFFLLVSFNLTALACAECRARVKDGIFDQSFWANLVVVLLPIVVIAAIGIGLYFTNEITDKLKKGASRWQKNDDVVR